MEISLLVYKQRFQNPNYKNTASKNYAHIRYIATRPRVAKNEGMSHGLFGCLTPGTSLTEFQDWRDVARLVYQNSKKNVTMYRSVISFTEKTAEELYLTDQKAWQRYIENHIRTIAEKNGMKRENFQWAAALHREKNHPHLHVVFWDKSSRIKNPYTPPAIPNAIRKQIIKDTFAGKIRAYGEAKNLAAADLRRISNELVEDFEQHMKRLGKKNFQRLIQEQELELELTETFEFDDQVLNQISGQVFHIRAALQKGRIAYQLLPPEIKKQVDDMVTYLLEKIPSLHDFKADYIESKMNMVNLYGGDEDYLTSMRKKFSEEADKIIANRILGMVKALNRMVSEGKSLEYLSRRSQHYAEQMLIEMLDILSTASNRNSQEFVGRDKILNSNGELSKEARKELYLKYQDKGYEH